MTIAGIYRSPSAAVTSSPSDQFFFDSLHQVGLFTEPVVILGDFNFPDVRWFDGLPDGSKKVEEDLAEALNDTNLVQLVNQPTRFRAQQAPSLLDLVFTNEPDATTLLTYLPPIGSSDHVTISLQLQCLLRRQPPPTTRSRRVRYFNLDYDRVVQVIALPTHEFLTTDNPSIHGHPFIHKPS